MTIAWNRVFNDLSICLKLLNFTNYVRSENGPDFKYKYLEENWEKKLIIRWSRWRYKISLNNFWLDNIDDNELHKFIKYNSHEEREQDRDKKRGNNVYEKF